MSDLRDRIAAVIDAQHVGEYQGGVHPEDVMRLADAVIAELGLRPDRVGTLTRWVTDWLDAPDPTARLHDFLATPIGQSLKAKDDRETA